jgi:hypothetical protein
VREAITSNGQSIAIRFRDEKQKRKTRPKPGFGLCHRAWRRSRTGRCAPAQLLNWLPVL